MLKRNFLKKKKKPKILKYVLLEYYFKFNFILINPLKRNKFQFFNIKS